MTPAELAARHPYLRQRDGTYPPDGMRYAAAGDGVPLPRPFYLRWLLPWFCSRAGGVRAWWAVWAGSWFVLAAGAFWWRIEAGDGWQRAVAAAVLLCGLPGVLGPPVVIPVGVDLSATALGVCVAATLAADVPGWWPAVVIVSLVVGSVKESAPLFVAVWAWSPWPLAGLAAPLLRHVYAKRRGLIGEDPLGPKFQAIADHPARAARAAHAGRWRDGWLMVAPWGVCLVALYRPDVQVFVALGVAYGLLLVATDTVRLVHHAAGPVMAVAAVRNLPVEWLALACVVHVAWFWRVERV